MENRKISANLVFMNNNIHSYVWEMLARPVLFIASSLAFQKIAMELHFEPLQMFVLLSNLLGNSLQSLIPGTMVPENRSGKW